MGADHDPCLLRQVNAKMITMQRLLAMHPHRRFFKLSPPNTKPSREGAFFLMNAKISLIVFLLSGLGLGSPMLAQESPAPSPERTRELIRLVRQDCGSCHGLTLRGGLGPALLPEALRDKPPAGLKYTILLGRPGTAMPPWQPFLSDAEADWIVAQLLRGFPEESK
jgi:cytochrome c55X